MKIIPKIRWAAYFGRTWVGWKTANRQDKRLAVSQFIQMDERGIEPEEPATPLVWIVFGKRGDLVLVEQTRVCVKCRNQCICSVGMR